MSMFKKAVKTSAKLRLAIAGPSGSGKTYTSLAIATALADGAPIAVVDTEHGSAAKYADLFSFDVAEMTPPFHPDKFVQFMADAAANGYAVVVLDSLTHAWSGTGGMLDLIDEIAKRKTGGNSFAAWKDGTPIQNRLIDAIVSSPIHVIATMRSKQDYVQDKDERGKTTVKKVGMAAQQREGFEYEFDVAFDMDIDNNAVVSKTRCPALTGRVFSKPGRDVAAILAEWLRGEPAKVSALVIVPPPAPTTGTNGTGDEPKLWQTWQTPADAKAWAVECGACKNEYEANNSLSKLVKEQFDGRLHTGNVSDVYAAFYAHQMDKLSKQAQGITVNGAQEMAH